jgi:hypothetical protein
MLATQKTSKCPAKLMTSNERKTLGFRSISNRQTVVDIATQNNVSRKFVYQQQNKIFSAVDEAFAVEDACYEEKVLFWLPVTKSWIYQFITVLTFDCRATYRCIIKAAQDLLDHDISIGTICNTLKSLSEKVKEIHAEENLSNVKLSAHDEMFHHNSPVLTGIDIKSLYCFLLSQETQRDGDTWAIKLLELQDKEYKPDRVFADDGEGLRAGHKFTFPDIPCDADIFHAIKLMGEMRRYFQNIYKSAITYRKQQEAKMAKAKERGNTQKHSRKLGAAKKRESLMKYLSENIATLISWMEHDVLNKAGSKPEHRHELYNFIVSELEKLSETHPHRIKAVCTTLKNQQHLLLAFADVLNGKFELIAEKFSTSTENIWKICELQRCDHESSTYAIRSVPLQLLLKDDFYLAEDLVVEAMDSTERSSSMIENLHSRLRPYLFLRKTILGNDYLEILRFHINHTQFLRSSNPNRTGKTPAELLFGKEHPHWLEMLGYKRFKQAA